MDFLKPLVNRLESFHLTLGRFISTALFIILIHNSIENIAAYGRLPSITAFDLIHVPIFFFSILLWLIVFLHFITKEKIARVSSICLILLSVSIVPASVNLLFSFFKTPGTAAVEYGYIFENSGIKFLRFFDPRFPIPELSLSLRWEIFLLCVLSVVYVQVKTGKILKSLLSFAGVFTICYLFVALPAKMIAEFEYIIYPLYKKFFSGLLGAQLDQPAIVIKELFLGTLALVLWYACYDKTKFRHLVKNIRLTRSIHYLFLVLLGFKMANLTIDPPDFFMLIKMGGLLAAFFFAFQFSVVTNDLVDHACDERSNPNRPLIKGKFTAGEYLGIGLVFLCLSFLFALWISANAFATVLLFVAFYFVYSMPPLRLKRWYLTSGIIIGLQGLIAFAGGYLAFQPPDVPVTLNPLLGLLLFLVFGLSGHIKDLKDVEGDKADGIQTIPVVLGPQDGRYLIGALVALSYILIPIFLGGAYLRSFYGMLAISFAFAVGNYFYIRRPDSNESVIFRIYFVYAVILLLMLK